MNMQKFKILIYLGILATDLFDLIDDEGREDSIFINLDDFFSIQDASFRFCRCQSSVFMRRCFVDDWLKLEIFWCWREFNSILTSWWKSGMSAGSSWLPCCRLILRHEDFNKGGKESLKNLTRIKFTATAIECYPESYLTRIVKKKHWIEGSSTSRKWFNLFSQNFVQGHFFKSIVFNEGENSS